MVLARAVHTTVRYRCAPPWQWKMLRREPTRIEMKPEDIEEFDQYVASKKAAAKQQQDDGASEKKTEKKERIESRIGYRPTMSDSPGY